MRTTKRAFSVLLLVGMILAIPASAQYYGSEVPPGGTFLSRYIDKNATGTKLFGTLTVFFEVEEPNDTCLLAPAEMYFFLRLKKPSTPFSGFSGVTELCLEDIDAQVTAVQQFLKDQVIPSPLFFPNSSNPTVALKSVTDVVQEDQFNFPGSPDFVTMDIELAVKE